MRAPSRPVLLLGRAILVHSQKPSTVVLYILSKTMGTEILLPLVGLRKIGHDTNVLPHGYFLRTTYTHFSPRQKLGRKEPAGSCACWSLYARLLCPGSDTRAPATQLCYATLVHGLSGIASCSFLRHLSCPESAPLRCHPFITTIVPGRLRRRPRLKKMECVIQGGGRTACDQLRYKGSVEERKCRKTRPNDALHACPRASQANF